MRRNILERRQVCRRMGLAVRKLMVRAPRPHVLESALKRRLFRSCASHATVGHMVTVSLHNSSLAMAAPPPPTSGGTPYDGPRYPGSLVVHHLKANVTEVVDRYRRQRKRRTGKRASA